MNEKLCVAQERKTSLIGMTVSLKDPGQWFGFTDGLAQPGFVIFFYDSM